MDLYSPKGNSYLLSQSIKSSIQVYGGDITIYAAFDSKGTFLAYSQINCFGPDLRIYKTSMEALYLLLKIDFYSEVDFLIMKIIEKRILQNLSISQMANVINVTVEEYIDIEEGITNLTEDKRKGICHKLNIKAITKTDFINIYFKQINNK